MNVANAKERLEQKRLREREQRHQQQLTEADHRIAELEEQLEAALLVANTPKNTIFSPAKRDKKTIGDCYAHLIASDWHVEERVDPLTVNNLNGFDLATASKRINRFFDRGLWLSSLLAKGISMRGLVVALLGDIITGQHREEAIENNLLSPSEAIEFAYDNIRAGLRLLKAEAKLFREPITVVCCSGNHGRTVDKPRAATRERHSFEWLLYRSLQREMQDATMRFEIATGYHLIRKEYGYPVRYHHGDAVRYQGGVGGLTIPVRKAIASWNRGSPAALDVFGHFHQQIDGGNFLANGSLVGYNAYAVRIKAEYERPQQTFFLLDRERGKILTAPIFVEEEGKK